MYTQSSIIKEKGVESELERSFLSRFRWLRCSLVGGRELIIAFDVAYNKYTESHNCAVVVVQRMCVCVGW